MFPSFSPALRDRWLAQRPLFVLGTLGILAGGVVAAIARPTGWGHGSWTAAYLVLVVGVGQLAVAFAQAALAPRVPSRGRIWAEVVCWNVGSGIIIAATQVDAPIPVAVGSAVFLAALAIAADVVRPRSDLTGSAALVLGLYRALLVILGVSVFVGIVLSVARA